VALEAIVSALLYVLRTGCPWRDLPCADFHWRTAYGYFVRWNRLGLWTALLRGLQKRAGGRLHAIDGTYVRVHHSGANPRGGQAAQHLGPSRGGLTTKIHAVVDGRGCPVRLVLSAGHVVDITMAADLVRGLGRSSCTTLLADKGYDSDALRLALLEENIFPCLAVSNKRIESRPFHRGYYRKRHRVENFFQSLKRWRRVATRYDKLASSFFAFVTLASILHWLRSNFFSNTS
jgi:transposase